MRIRALATFLVVAIGPPIGVSAGPVENCNDQRIVRFGETTKSIAQRCGVTPGAIERQNPGLHLGGAKQGVRIKVPRPSLPTPQIKIGGNAAISGTARLSISITR